MPRPLLPISVLIAALLLILLVLRPGCESGGGSPAEVPKDRDATTRPTSGPHRAVGPRSSTGERPASSRGEAAADEGGRPTARPAAGQGLLAEGRIVDDLERPCPGVLVQILEAFEENAGSGDLPLASGRSDDEGRFRLYGPERLRIDLRCEAGDRPLRPRHLRDLPAGRHDLEIRLDRAAALAGSIRPPEGLSGSWFTIMLVDEGNGALIEGTTLQPEGNFRIDGLDPGLRRLVIGLIGDDEALLEIDNLRLLPGQDCPDPRLREISFASPVDSFELEVVDGNGDPLAGARIISVAERHLAGTSIFSATTTDSEGRTRLPLIAGGLDLEIGHPGFEYRTVEHMKERRCIALAPAPLIALHLPSPELALPPGVLLELRFRYGDKKRLGSEALLASRVPDDVITIASLPTQISYPLQRRGEYEIVMNLRRDDATDAVPVGSLWLTLDEKRPEQSLPLGARVTEFRRALERLQASR